jgi:hypothetical protein
MRFSDKSVRGPRLLVKKLTGGFDNGLGAILIAKRLRHLLVHGVDSLAKISDFAARPDRPRHSQQRNLVCQKEGNAPTRLNENKVS